MPELQKVYLFGPPRTDQPMHDLHYLARAVNENRGHIVNPSVLKAPTIDAGTRIGTSNFTLLRKADCGIGLLHDSFFGIETIVGGLLALQKSVLLLRPSSRGTSLAELPEFWLEKNIDDTLRIDYFRDCDEFGPMVSAFMDRYRRIGRVA
jgi:hypothetical protein